MCSFRRETRRRVSGYQSRVVLPIEVVDDKTFLNSFFPSVRQRRCKQDLFRQGLMMVGRMWAGRSMLPRRCSSLLSSRTSSTFNPPARDFVSGRCCGASRELQGSNDIISSPSNIRWQSTRASANASAKAAHNPSGFTFPGPRSLKDIVRLPLLEKKSEFYLEYTFGYIHWKSYANALLANMRCVIVFCALQNRCGRGWGNMEKVS